MGCFRADPNFLTMFQGITNMSPCFSLEQKCIIIYLIGKNSPCKISTMVYIKKHDCKIIQRWYCLELIPIFGLTKIQVLTQEPISPKFFHSTDIDDCITRPCLNDGTCIDEVNGYTCACVDGYEGSICKTGMLTNCLCISNRLCSQEIRLDIIVILKIK